MSREDADAKREMATLDILRTVTSRQVALGEGMTIKDLMAEFFPEPAYNKDIFSWAMIQLLDSGSLVYDGDRLCVVAQG